MRTIAACFALLAAAPPLRADSPPVLAEHGASGYRIILPADAIPSERHAAEELRAIFKRMSGAELPVMTETEPTGDREICLNARARIATVDPEFAKVIPGRDGYAVRTKGERLLVLGDRPRGTLYAVYALLEERFGCRWFTREVERIPTKDRWELPVLDLAYAPPFEYREVYWRETQEADWAARRGLNGSGYPLDERHGGKITYQPFVHSFDSILPPEKHFAEHPEWYSEIDGKRRWDGPQRTQLCLTNPEVLRRTIEAVKGWMREHPEATIYSVSQNDNTRPCTCAACRASDEREGSPAGTLVTFVNAVAEAVEKEFPGKRIDTLAYQYTRKPPKTVRPRSNVRVRLCSIECCFSHPLDVCAVNRSFVDDITGWSKITDRLYIWDYTTNYAHYLAPFPNFEVLGPNVRFFRDHGVVGMFEQGNYHGGGEFGELRSYLLAKLLWNPGIDLNEALREYTDAVYGEAGKTVRDYLKLLHTPVRDGPDVHATIYLPPKKSGWITKEFIDRSMKLFDDALAAGKDEPVRKRLRHARLPIDYIRVLWADGGSPARAERLEAFVAACKELGITHVAEGMRVDEFEKRMK